MTFEDRVQRVLASLPAELREALRQRYALVEPEQVGLVGMLVLDRDLHVADRGDWAGALPDRIRIFRLPLVESFPDPAELEEEIRITVLHEVAHYFGLDEDRLDDLGFS